MMSAARPYVVFAGNVATGKSTLARLFCARYGFSYLGEPVDELSYVDEFFTDMPAWAFHHQLDFLLLKGSQEAASSIHQGSVCEDRSVDDCFKVFTRLSYEEGWLSHKEWLLMSRLHACLASHFPAPDLVVHLTASISTLTERIARRGRRYETSVQSRWLDGIEKAYERWIAGLSVPVLRIDTGHDDFIQEPCRVELLQREIAGALTTAWGWKPDEP